MSADPAWAEANNRYLAESLRWLRLRLKSRVGGPLAPVAPPPVPAPEEWTGRRSWFAGGRSAPPRSPSPPLLIAPEDSEPAAAQARAEAAAVDPPPALLLLAERLGLTSFERDTLLLCVAPELEPDIATLFSGADNQKTQGAPSFALALHLLDDASWDALSPHRPLRYARLIEVNQPAATPLTAAPLRADERIVHYIKGLNALDERLERLLTPVGDGGASRLSASQLAVAEDILRQLQAAGAAVQVPLVTLIGDDLGSQLETARHVARAVGRRLYRIGLDALPSAPAELDALVRLWQRERLLMPITLFVDAHEFAGGPAEQAAAFLAFASRDVGLAIAGVREPLGRGVAHALSFDVARPTAREQHEAWTVAFGEGGADPAARLAGHFDLNLSDIGQAVALAAFASGQEPGEPPAEADVWNACRRATQPRLDRLAQRLEPRATWDDLVLGDEATALLRQIAAQARNRFRVYEEWGYAARMTRGFGISVLFAGESGTGKTMAAEVIANELQLAVYRIDLSAVVSKYIGETEKNLRRLFDAAEQGGTILLFDEADALFGKRSEVKDSHDRYANIEINYLLQRIEAFSGLAILATNMKNALDVAFQRRLRFIVNFPYPGPAERERMWWLALPSELPRGELDFQRLARFGLSGGNIHSIALNAAFMAAARGEPLSQGLLLSAVRTELRKLDKPVNEAEFR